MAGAKLRCVEFSYAPLHLKNTWRKLKDKCPQQFERGGFYPRNFYRLGGCANSAQQMGQRHKKSLSQRLANRDDPGKRSKIRQLGDKGRTRVYHFDWLEMSSPAISQWMPLISIPLDKGVNISIRNG
jgi:hypothetical protein